MRTSWHRSISALLTSAAILLFQGSASAAQSPAVTSVSPGRASSVGGTRVGIIGSRFEPGVVVYFGNVLAQNTEFVSSTRLNAVTPAMGKGFSAVKAVNPGGKSGTLSNAIEFFYAGGILSLSGYAVPPDIESGWDADFGDVDGDGDLDVLISNLPGPKRLYLNNGRGVFEDVSSTSLPADPEIYSRDIAFGDIDGDGDLDFIETVTDGQSRLYRNDGRGVYTNITGSNLPPKTGNSWDASFGDVDGDGDLDIFLTDILGQDSLYLNDGAGSFTDVSAARLPAGTSATYAAKLGDVDGDGDLDILLGKFQQVSRLFLNNGTGFFLDVTPTNMPGRYTSAFGVDLGDVDGDGDLDAVFANYWYGQQDLLYINDGSGVFRDESNRMPADGDWGSSVEFGDADSDGDLDILVANLVISSSDGQSHLFLNDGSGWFTDASATHLPQSNDSSGDAEFGDVDGDGDLDIFVTNYVRQQDKLLLNSGSGHYTDTTSSRFPVDHANARNVRLFDADNDSDLDAFLVNDGQDFLYLNTNGTFTDATASNLPADISQGVDAAIGDVNGDGTLDVFVANYGTQNRLYVNDGGGVFTDRTLASLPPDTDQSWSTVFLDADGDSDLDLLVVNDMQQNRLYLNTGNGAFVDASANLPPDLFNGRKALARDWDRDGDIDIFIAGYPNARLYLNNGLGIFHDATVTHLPESYSNGTGADAGDVDGDGDMDIYTTGASLLLNDGSGIFSTRSAPGWPEASAARMGDIDRDGDADIFVAVQGWPNRIYLNDGFGGFSDGTGTCLPSDMRSYAMGVDLGDVDGDGDLDALVANNTGSSLLYINQDTLDSKPPSIPTAVTATAISSSRIDLAWQASTDNVGVAGYTLYRNGAAVATTAGTSFSDNGLAENSGYCYAVDAFDSDGNHSPQSLPACATTPSRPWLRVASITFSTQVVSRTEYLSIKTRITDSAAQGVPGASVQGVLTLPAGGTVPYSGTTDSTGLVTFSYSVRNKPLGSGSYIFLVTGVSHSSFVYDPSQNIVTSTTFTK